MHVPTVATLPDGTGGGCDEQLDEGESHARNMAPDDDVPGLFMCFYGIGWRGGVHHHAPTHSPEEHKLRRP